MKKDEEQGDIWFAVFWISYLTIIGVIGYWLMGLI